MTDSGGNGDRALMEPAKDDGRIPVAAFDFDGTLTSGDSLLPFLRYATGRRRFWTRSPFLLGYWLLFRLGRMDRSGAKEAVLRRYLGGARVERVRAAAQEFAARVLPSLVNPSAMERLLWHREAGHRVLIVSASLETYLQPWAGAFAGAEAVLGTRLRTQDGLVTGELDGPNCVGPEKVSRLTEYLGNLEGQYVFAYGDSSSDLDLLGAAQQPAYRSFDGRWGRLRGYLRLLRVLL